MLQTVITMALLVLVLVFVLPIILRKLFHEKDGKNDFFNVDFFIIQAPQKVKIILAIVTVILSIALVVLELCVDIPIYATIIFIMFVLFCAFAVYSAREKIVVKFDVIEYTPLFGKNRIYNFSDVKKVVAVRYNYDFISYKVYTTEKIFSLENIFNNTDLFLEKAKSLNIPIVGINQKD